MPRYFFIVRWPHDEDDDDEGIVLASDDAASAYAQRIIRELHTVGGYDDPELVLVVKNEAGHTIFALPFCPVQRDGP